MPVMQGPPSRLVTIRGPAALTIYWARLHPSSPGPGERGGQRHRSSSKHRKSL